MSKKTFTMAFGGKNGGKTDETDLPDNAVGLSLPSLFYRAGLI